MGKIYTEVGDSIGKVELIDYMGSDKHIVDAARVSYNNDAKEFDIASDTKLIRYLLKNKHTSPFEHCVMTFHFVVPLFVRSQLHRHRTWAYNEISRRYTSEYLEFYLPNYLRGQATDNKQMSNDVKINEINGESILSYLKTKAHAAMNDYERLLSAGIAREQARIVLPQNLYTRYYGTVSLHNLMHFLNLRDHPHAQWEAQMAAKECKKLVHRIFPVTMKVYDELR